MGLFPAYARSLLKEPKIYFFDNGLVQGDNGAKFENFVATCLLKHVFAKADYEGQNYSLKYLQTKERQEVDFVLVHDKQVEHMIEVKYADSSIHPGLRYFHDKYKIPATQVVKELKYETIDRGIEVVQGLHFLQSL